jgi:RNA polymerase primary sigma factor
MVEADRISRRELVQLYSRGNEQGHLTIQDIFELCPNVNEDNLHQVVLPLQGRGIDILDEDGEPFSLQDETEETQESEISLEHIAAYDTVGLYLKEMARVPLLTVDQELDLARRIEKGTLARRKLQRSNGNLTLEERRELEAFDQDGVSARDHLIRANTRLVVSVAKRHVGRGLPLLDLVQEGNLGLMKAVEKYDYHRGFRFSTYATWWIRQTITRALANQGRTIRVPVHMLDRIHQMYRISRELEQDLGRPPTNTELASELGVNAGRVQWMRRLSWSPLSLETPVGDEEDSELGMFIEDTFSPAPNQTTQENLLREKIEEVLGTLSPREARILRLRFGLDNGHSLTLEEVGRRFGLSRERIRQIESRALKRLRHPCRSRQLREYI